MLYFSCFYFYKTDEGFQYAGEHHRIQSRRIHLIQQSIWCKTDFIKVLSDTKDFQFPLNSVY